MTSFSLRGKTALLTGSTGFFGTYFAKALEEAGVARLILIDRDAERLRRQKADLEGICRTMIIALDLYDRKAADEMLTRIGATEAVDILINNAFDFSVRTGFNTPDGRLECATFDELQACFESGAWWAIQATQAIGYPMKARRHGSIINICSMYGVVVPHPSLYEGTEKFNPPGYSMAKAGLLQFTRYAASFLGPEVRVNAMSPGAIPNLETVSDNAVDAQRERDFIQRLTDRTLLKRVGHPNDLTGPLVFLASDASAYVTGHNLVVDGGWTVT